MQFPVCSALRDANSTCADMAEGPFAFKDDGTAKDPKAFQQALRADAERMAALDSEPEVKRIVLGDDMHAFQEFIKGVYHVCCSRDLFWRAACCSLQES